MFKAIKHHWPEYLMEAWGLGISMIAACLGTILLWHPDSPVEHFVHGQPYVQRFMMGVAMGATASDHFLAKLSNGMPSRITIANQFVRPGGLRK